VCSIVLCCAVLCCTSECCTAMHWTVNMQHFLYCIVLFCIVLYCIVLRCIVLYCSAQHYKYTVLHTQYIYCIAHTVYTLYCSHNINISCLKKKAIKHTKPKIIFSFQPWQESHNLLLHGKTGQLPVSKRDRHRRFEDRLLNDVKKIRGKKNTISASDFSIGEKVRH
jgi:hypothetical protein